MNSSLRGGAGLASAMAWRALVGLLVGLAGCGSGRAPAQAGSADAGANGALDSSAGDSSAPGPGCPTAYQRVTAEDSGHELAVAYREHVPTAAEQAVAAAMWAVLINGFKDGQLDQDLFQRLATAPALSGIAAAYPTAFRPCQASTTLVSQAVISDPFQCTDDCLIGINDVAPLLVEPLVRGLRSLGGAFEVSRDAVALTYALKMTLADPAMAGRSIQAAAERSISQESSGALLAAIFDAIGKSVAITAGVAELAAAADLALPLAATGAMIALGVYVAKLLLLANRIEACKAWKALNCPCMGPACGCAQLGESARGTMCCAQGGPTADGGWYLITASPTCCVLNRAEYGKHSGMCYAAPDKKPGACPSCSSDAECCDRQGLSRNVDRCIGGRCCGPDSPERPGTPTMVDFSCCSGVRYQVDGDARYCAPAP